VHFDKINFSQESNNLNSLISQQYQEGNNLLEEIVQEYELTSVGKHS